MFTQPTGAIISLFYIYIIASYLFVAIGLHKISELRGHNKPWLAFIPIANYYLLGFIADNINAYQNKRSNYRIVLLVLAIIYSLFKVIKNILKWNILNGDNPSYFYFLVSIVVGILALVMLVFSFIVLYKIYKDYLPDKAVVMLVFSIIFHFITPFIIFSIRRNPSVSIKNDNEQRINQLQEQQYD